MQEPYVDKVEIKVSKLIVRRQLRIGRVFVDALRRSEALDAITRLVDSGVGGPVFTPNVDHVVMAEDMDELAYAYSRVSLSLADGMPIVWASRLLGRSIPEKLSGSDMIEPIAALAAREGWPIYFLGGRTNSARMAASNLSARYPGLKVVGYESPIMSLAPGHSGTHEAFSRVQRSGARILMVGLSGPKQEILLHRTREYLGPVLSFGVGAGIDFAAGVAKRSPAWMSRIGLEWLYRLYNEPGRLWRRYILRDPRFIGIVWRTLRTPMEDRVGTRPLLPAKRGAL